MSNRMNQPVQITITAGAVIKVLFVILLAYFLFVIRDLIVVLLASIVIASSIEPGTRFFMKYKLPRVVSVLSVYAVVLAILIGLVYIFLPPLMDDFQNLSASFPTYVSAITEVAPETESGTLNSIVGYFSEQLAGYDIVNRIGQTVSGATVGFFSIATSVFGGVLSFLLIIVLSFYLSVQEDGVAKFLHLITPQNHRTYVNGLWRRARKKIGLWMQGQLLLAVIIGVLTYLGLSVLGVPNPMFLAVVAGVFELIPIFGPLLAAIPAVLFAFAGGDVTLAAMTFGLYLIIQQFENQLIHPLVVKKIVGIPSIVAIISLVIGAQIAGFLGVILAVPIAAAVMELLHDIDRGKFLINEKK